MLSDVQPWMLPQLTTLWRGCFGDSEAYISFFLTRRLPTCEALVWLEEGAPVGAVYLLPCTVDGQPGLYAYAGAVLPCCRGCGIFSALLEAAERLSTRRSAWFFLVPAPGTEGFYCRRGFHTAFRYHWEEYGASGSALPLLVTDADAAGYERLRNACLPAGGVVRWNRAAVDYALAENSFCGGFAAHLAWEGREAVLLGRREGDTLAVAETTLTPPEAARLAPAICEAWGVGRIRFRLPGGECPGGSTFGRPAWDTGWLGLELF